MIDAWDVYWVMQMDSIVGLFTAVSVLSGLAAFPLFVFGLVEESKTLIRYGTISLSALIFSSVLVGFLPSTQTLAAMYVVPALTSDEVVDFTKGEARELLDITKQALRSHIEQKEVGK